MRSVVLHLWLVVLMLCNFLGSNIEVKAQTTMHDRTDHKEQVCRHSDLLHNMAEEPRRPIGSSLTSSLPSHRVASHRTVRLLPTHGSKPSNKSGRWATVSLSNLQKYVPICLCRLLDASGMGFASPRLYYVIALRRILC